MATGFARKGMAVTAEILGGGNRQADFSLKKTRTNKNTFSYCKLFFLITSPALFKNQSLDYSTEDSTPTVFCASTPNPSLEVGSPLLPAAAHSPEAT